MTVVRRIRPDEGAALRDVRLAALADKLAAVESERQRLHSVRRYNEVVSFALDVDLARRAGLAAAGKPVEIPNISRAWDSALAPLREALKITERSAADGS